MASRSDATAAVEKAHDEPHLSTPKSQKSSRRQNRVASKEEDVPGALKRTTSFSAFHFRLRDENWNSQLSIDRGRCLMMILPALVAHRLQQAAPLNAAVETLRQIASVVFLSDRVHGQDLHVEDTRKKNTGKRHWNVRVEHRFPNCEIQSQIPDGNGN